MYVRMSSARCAWPSSNPFDPDLVVLLCGNLPDDRRVLHGLLLFRSNLPCIHWRLRRSSSTLSAPGRPLGQSSSGCRRLCSSELASEGHSQALPNDQQRTTYCKRKVTISTKLPEFKDCLYLPVTSLEAFWSCNRQKPNMIPEVEQTVESVESSC